MDLSREVIEREIIGAKTAIKSFRETIEIHKFVLEGLTEALEKLPKKA